VVGGEGYTACLVKETWAGLKRDTNAHAPISQPRSLRSSADVVPRFLCNASPHVQFTRDLMLAMVVL